MYNDHNNPNNTPPLKDFAQKVREPLLHNIQTLPSGINKVFTLPLNQKLSDSPAAKLMSPFLENRC